MGRKMPRLAVKTAKMMHADTVEGSQLGYCSSIRHWVNFNLEFDEDLLNFQLIRTKPCSGSIPGLKNQEV